MIKRSMKTKNKIVNSIIYVILSVLSVIWVFPVAWLIM